MSYAKSIRFCEELEVKNIPLDKLEQMCKEVGIDKPKVVICISQTKEKSTKKSKIPKIVVSAPQ